MTETVAPPETAELQTLKKIEELGSLTALREHTTLYFLCDVSSSMGWQDRGGTAIDLVVEHLIQEESKGAPLSIMPWANTVKRDNVPLSRLRSMVGGGTYPENAVKRCTELLRTYGTHSRVVMLTDGEWSYSLTELFNEAVEEYMSAGGHLELLFFCDRIPAGLTDKIKVTSGKGRQALTEAVRPTLYLSA